MAKTSYTKETIVAFIKGRDVRATSLTDLDINSIIDRAYAELMTVSKRLFSAEEVRPLDDYYAVGEEKTTFITEVDAIEVYDVYLTIEDDQADKGICQEVVQGIGLFRNDNIVYRDNRYIGKIHVRLGAPLIKDVVFDNAIMKYYYTPQSSDTAVTMDGQVYLAFQDALWAALSYFLKDIETESQKRASMKRTAAASNLEPEDVPDAPRAIFGGL